MVTQSSQPSLPYRPCVGIVLTNDAGLVWIGRRVGSADSWQMPQGGIDQGETPRQAVMRELHEETGLTTAEIVAESQEWYRYDLPAAVTGRALRGRYGGQEQRWFLMRFTGRESDFDLSVHHQEFSAWRWADPAEVTRIIVDFKRPVYEQVFAEFGPLLADMAGR